MTPPPIDDATPEQKGPKGSRRARDLRRWLAPAAVAAGAFVLLLSPLWLPLILREFAFFRVRHVEVVGARYLDARDIVDRLQVDTLASVWDDTGPWHARVAAHPLVRDVDVGRRLPGTLVIRVAEHVPVALVPASGGRGFQAYDVRGVALPIDPARADVDAPILARPDSVMLHLLSEARIRAPALYHRMSEVRPGGAGEIVLVLDSLSVRALAGITLQRLADLEPVEKDLARRGLRPTELDLRYRDQVIARLP
ncbi:MAG: FtsQ-type POTRA domain-containing protein [Gemmatimonadaceae bacterium]